MRTDSKLTFRNLSDRVITIGSVSIQPGSVGAVSEKWCLRKNAYVQRMIRQGVLSSNLSAIAVATEPTEIKDNNDTEPEKDKIDSDKDVSKDTDTDSKPTDPLSDLEITPIQTPTYL